MKTILVLMLGLMSSNAFAEDFYRSKKVMEDLRVRSTTYFCESAPNVTQMQAQADAVLSQLGDQIEIINNSVSVASGGAYSAGPAAVICFTVKKAQR